MSLLVFGENLFVHELLHLSVGTVLAAFVYKKYKSIRLSILAFAVNLLIDVDHLYEGLLVYGLNFKDMLLPFRGGFFSEAGKMTIFFHSWEIVPFLLLSGKILSRSKLTVVISLALIGHLLTDQIVYTGLYGMSVFEYSIIYRAMKNFDFWRLCGGC